LSYRRPMLQFVKVHVAVLTGVLNFEIQRRAFKLCIVAFDVVTLWLTLNFRPRVPEGFFPGEGSNGFFQWGSNVVMFHFTNSKLGEKYFSTKKLIGKYRISESRGSKNPPPFRRTCFQSSTSASCNNFKTLARKKALKLSFR